MIDYLKEINKNIKLLPVILVYLTQIATSACLILVIDEMTIKEFKFRKSCHSKFRLTLRVAERSDVKFAKSKKCNKPSTSWIRARG